MRKHVLLCWALTVCALLCCLASAHAESAVIDEAGLLTSREEVELTNAIDDIRQNYNMDVVILLKRNIGGREARMYAADYYDDHGYGVGESRDGLIFLLTIAEREYFTSTCGRAIDLFSDWTLDTIHADITPYLTRAEYATALTRYLSQIGDVLQSAAEESGQNALTASPVSRFFFNRRAFDRANGALPVILVVALALALCVALSLRAQMRTVRRKNTANSYVKDGSFHLSRIQDIYLYTSETRRKIESDSSSGGGGHGGSSTYHSSSGTTHGGRGGTF